MDPKEASNIEEEKNNLKILFEVEKDNVNNISNIISRVEGKAGTLMGIEIALITAYSVLVLKEVVDEIDFWLSILGLLFLAVSVYFLLFGTIRSKTYLTILVDPKKYPECFKQSEKKLLLHLISAAQETSTHNNCILEKKALNYRWATNLFIFGAFLLVSPFIFTPLVDYILDILSNISF